MSSHGLVAGVAAHLQDPMRRSSYALILGTGLTSGLGLVFWVLAARWVPPSSVGIGVALVSAMTFLATLSTLGLRNSMVRFLPAAGTHARQLVGRSYVLCALAATIAAVIFVLGQPWWAGKLGLLRDSLWAGPAFVVATSLWVIFILQSDVLVGLGRAGWVPVANGFASAAKILLLPVLAFSGGWAVFGASVLPAAAVVIVGAVLTLRASSPRVPDHDPPPVELPQLVRFAATDHFSALLWIATENLLTLVVLHQAGAEASAYYFMSFMMGYPLYLVTLNIGSALVAQVSRTPRHADALARQALVHAVQIVVPFALIGCILAPLVLGLLGAAYALNGTLLLQLILVSALPQTLVGISLSMARIRQDYRLILIIYSGLAVGIFGGSWLTVSTWGLTGVGVAWLGMQTLAAVALLLTGQTGLPPWRRSLGQANAPVTTAQLPPGSGST